VRGYYKHLARIHPDDELVKNDKHWRIKVLKPGKDEE